MLQVSQGAQCGIIKRRRWLSDALAGHLAEPLSILLSMRLFILIYNQKIDSQLFLS